jgi:hypothetical protein
MRRFSDFLGLVIARFIWSHFPYQSGVMIPGHYLFRSCSDPLDGVAGLLTGTPTQAGMFQVQMQVNDASVTPYSMQPQTHIRYLTFVIRP